MFIDNNFTVHSLVMTLCCIYLSWIQGYFLQFYMIITESLLSVKNFTGFARLQSFIFAHSLWNYAIFIYSESNEFFIFYDLHLKFIYLLKFIFNKIYSYWIHSLHSFINIFFRSLVMNLCCIFKWSTYYKDHLNDKWSIYNIYLM